MLHHPSEESTIDIDGSSSSSTSALNSPPLKKLAANSVRPKPEFRKPKPEPLRPANILAVISAPPKPQPHRASCTSKDPLLYPLDHQTAPPQPLFPQLITLKNLYSLNLLALDFWPTLFAGLEIAIVAWHRQTAAAAYIFRRSPGERGSCCAFFQHPGRRVCPWMKNRGRSKQPSFAVDAAKPLLELN